MYRYLALCAAIGIIGISGVIALVPRNAAAITCDAGFHVVGENEIPGIAAGSTCTPDDATKTTNLLYGGCTFNPYPVIEKYKQNSGIQLTPTTLVTSSLQDGINPALACRLAVFLQASDQRGCHFSISSGFRGIAQQQAACQHVCGNPAGCPVNCAPPGSSCHQYGLAVDINGSDTCMQWAHQTLGLGAIAAGGQQFKIFFPAPKDGPHIQCIENTHAGCNTSTKGCDGSVAINPDLSTIGNPSATLPQQISNYLRQLIGGQQQQQGMYSPAQVAQPQYNGNPYSQGQANTQTQSSSSGGSSPTACTPSYFCSGDTYYYKNSACQNVQVQTCAYGCNGDSCALPPASSQINLNTNTSDNTNTNTNTSSGNANSTSSTSTLQQILSYANPTATDIATATPVVLNQDLGNISSAVSQAQNPAQTGGQTYTSSDMSTLQPTGAQPTFTSQDLANSAPQASAQNTFALNMLESMKQSLLVALNYLHPFAGIAQKQTYSE